MRGNCFALAARAAAAAILGLLLLLPTARDAGASERRNDRILLPSAGWHGRGIQEPHRHETVLTSTAGQPRGWSAGPVRYGDGFHRPGGSDRVREVQRRLARLGYRVGPIDGLFGRLTRASVAWFQVKHGLPVTGRATLATVDHLRARTGAPPGQGAARTAQPPAESEPAAARAPAWEAFRQLVGPRVPVPGGRSARTGWPTEMWALIALVAVDVLLLLALLVQRRRSGVIRTIALGPPAPVEARPRPAVLPSRRFAPPVPAAPGRPPDGVQAATREARDE